MEEYENGQKIEEETQEIEPKSVPGNDFTDLGYKYPEENEDIYVTTEVGKYPEENEEIYGTTELAVEKNEMGSDIEEGKDGVNVSGAEETEENRLLPSSNGNLGVLSDIGTDHGENVQVNNDYVDDDPSTGIETENRDTTQPANIANPSLVRQRTPWEGCCGLFQLLRGSND